MKTEPPLVEAAEKPPFLTVTALVLAALLATFAMAMPQAFMDFTNGANAAFMAVAANGVVVASSLLLLFCLLVAVSPLGRIRLGMDDEKPEFSTLAWLAMLFAAGMGSGLLFWGVAEPMLHLNAPPPVDGAMAETGGARIAIVISYLHWALHPWGIYASGALCIAYFSFCKGFAMLPSSPFRAALPGRHPISHALADIIDVVCVIALLLGLAAAIALGTTQIASGTAWLGNPLEGGITSQLLIMLALVTVYLLSASTRLNKGIKILSQVNMVVVLMLAAALLFIGPAESIFSTLWRGTLDYLRFLPELSFTPPSNDAGRGWLGIWTANYFLAWIAWVPFVGIFIARISRGRTIREFITGVVGVPTLFTLAWFAILGGTALHVQESGQMDLAAAVQANPSQALFSMLSLFPASWLLSFTAVFLVFIFLVTSADSASYVLAVMARQGKSHPTRRAKLFWGMALALLTTGTLFSESGVHAMRALFSFAGIAVIFILLGQMLCLTWGLLGHSRSKRDNAEY